MPKAIVAHGDEDFSPGQPRGKLDPPSGRGIFCRIRQQVEHDLLQPGGVRLDPQRSGRIIAEEFVLARADETGRGIPRSIEDRGDVEDLFPEANLSGRDSRYIQKIVDQMSQLAALPDDHSGRPFMIFPHWTREQRGGVRHGGQRIAKLVGQHGEKLILFAIGIIEAFEKVAHLILPPAGSQRDFASAHEGLRPDGPLDDGDIPRRAERGQDGGSARGRCCPRR